MNIQMQAGVQEGMPHLEWLAADKARAPVADPRVEAIARAEVRLRRSWARLGRQLRR